MSRYQLLSVVPGTKVFVGWDTMLQTFQAQVLGRPATPDGEPTVLLSIGRTQGECLTVAELAGHTSPWAIVPPGIAADLERERDTVGAPARPQAGRVTANRSARDPR